MENIDKKSDYNILDIPYSETTWYRRRWVLIILMILFMPAVIGIAMSGKIYGQIKGQTVEFNKSFNIQVTIGAIILMLFNILKYTI